MITKKIIKYFLPSLILFLLFRFLSLFSACFYGSDYSYYLDPFSPCENYFADITAYHWIIILVILPGLSYLNEVTGRLAKQNKIMYILNIIITVCFVFLIIFILLFKQFLDFPFWSHFTDPVL